MLRCGKFVPMQTSNSSFTHRTTMILLAVPGLQMEEDRVFSKFGDIWLSHPSPSNLQHLTAIVALRAGEQPISNRRFRGADPKAIARIFKEFTLSNHVALCHMCHIITRSNIRGEGRFCFLSKLLLQICLAVSGLDTVLTEMLDDSRSCARLASSGK